MTSEKNSSFNENMPSNDSFEVLENEFDKAFVDLDVFIGEYEQDNKDLQNSNNKLIGVLATNSLLEEQSEQLLLRVHSLQCQLYSKTAPHESEIIKKKLDKEMRMFNTKNLPITKSQAEISLLKEENLRLKSLLNSVHSEIYGARLAAKYLDKELAGRVPDVKDFVRQQNDLKHQKPTTSKNTSHPNKKCLPTFPLLSPCSPSSSINSLTSTCNSLCEQHFERQNIKTLNNSCSASSVSYESATDECNNSNIKLCLNESLNAKSEFNDKNMPINKNGGNPFI
uniref:VPS37 C-terminal domain-containing protein n=1 Tax=Meloidogyne hapla TaxID=6305 RepID=A0A1I8B2U3_MELHA